MAEGAQRYLQEEKYLRSRVAAGVAHGQLENNVIFIRTPKMNADNQIQAVWAYEVKDEFIDQFKEAYGPDGKWANLFRHCPGYIKTLLLRDFDNPNRFITIDSWQSYAAYSSMKEIVTSEYEYLDKQCEPYTATEDHLGIYEMIDDWKNDA